MITRRARHDVISALERKAHTARKHSTALHCTKADRKQEEANKRNEKLISSQHYHRDGFTGLLIQHHCIHRVLISLRKIRPLITSNSIQHCTALVDHIIRKSPKSRVLTVERKLSCSRNSHVRTCPRGRSGGINSTWWTEPTLRMDVTPLDLLHGTLQAKDNRVAVLWEQHVVLNVLITIHIDTHIQFYK